LNPPLFSLPAYRNLGNHDHVQPNPAMHALSQAGAIAAQFFAPLLVEKVFAK
jgi:hypothetical protein